MIVSVGLLDEYLRQLQALHLFVRSLQAIEIFPEEMKEAGRGRGRPPLNSGGQEDGRGLESLSGGQEEMERRPLAGDPPADLQQEREAVSVLLCVQQDSHVLAAVLGPH